MRIDGFIYSTQNTYEGILFLDFRVYTQEQRKNKLFTKAFSEAL